MDNQRPELSEHKHNSHCDSNEPVQGHKKAHVGHNQNHSHSHGDLADMSSTRISWAFFLNVSFTVIEFIGAWLTNSTAIIADAVHDLGGQLVHWQRVGAQ
jgi:cobalt-zinc-cadmium efflux system protein